MRDFEEIKMIPHGYRSWAVVVDGKIWRNGLTRQEAIDLIRRVTGENVNKNATRVDKNALRAAFGKLNEE